MLSIIHTVINYEGIVTGWKIKEKHVSMEIKSHSAFLLGTGMLFLSTWHVGYHAFDKNDGIMDGQDKEKTGEKE